MDDEELKALTHEVSQVTMKTLEGVFMDRCIETNDPRYFFAAEAVKERREASRIVWARDHEGLTGTPLFELDSDQNQNQDQKG